MAGRDCDDSLHELYTYLDGELTDERRQKIKEHLDECPPCLDRFDFEDELRHVIAKKCVDKVPESLMDRIASALAAENR